MKHNEIAKKAFGAWAKYRGALKATITQMSGHPIPPECNELLKLAYAAGYADALMDAENEDIASLEDYLEEQRQRKETK